MPFRPLTFDFVLGGMKLGRSKDGPNRRITNHSEFWIVRHPELKKFCDLRASASINLATKALTAEDLGVSFDSAQPMK
ncbi:MAG: hypothetical protein HC780_25265 [Leptolyngbyaceae cyanobacterium CSU_1_3]|nr:hypothetical protein [Leptolyngbyaceae cyanobacterium CSU_1_3]